MPISAWLALAALTSAPQPVLAWQAPDECPDADAVIAMTATLQQQRSPLLVDPELPAARGVVTRKSSGAWLLQLELHDHRGTRERRLQADECPLLARAAALVLAIHLDARTRDAAALREPPILASPPPEPIPPLEPSPEPSPEPPEPSLAPTASPRVLRPRLAAQPPRPDLSSVIVVDELAEPPRPPEPEPPATPRLAGHLRVEGGLDVRLLPGVGGSVGLAGGPAIRGVRIEAGILAAPARFTTINPASGQVHGRFDRLVANLRVCPGGPLRRGLLDLHGCLGGEAGAIRAVADYGVSNPNPQWAPSFALVLGPALRLRLAGPVGLWLAIEGVIALNRPKFTVRSGGDSLYQVTQPGLRIHLGFDLQFVARKR